MPEELYNDEPAQYDAENYQLRPQDRYALFLKLFEEYMSKAASPQYANLGELNRQMAAEIETILALHEENMSHDILYTWAEMADLLDASPEEQYKHIVRTVGMLNKWAVRAGISVGTLIDMAEEIRSMVTDEMIEAAEIVKVRRHMVDDVYMDLEFKGDLETLRKKIEGVKVEKKTLKDERYLKKPIEVEIERLPDGKFLVWCDELKGSHKCFIHKS